jgi:hypothetical protein
MVWSPVFVPERLEPVTVPEAATEVGVIAPRDSAPPLKPMPLLNVTADHVLAPER